jgi:plastocyanin
MKNLTKLVLAFTLIIFSSALFAQEASVIKLDQKEGVFVVKNLTLSAGDYTFEITNQGVDHEVGFVLAPKGKTEPENHIKDAYLTTTPKNGEKGTSKTVTLAKGEYVYFCPLNPTPQYTLTVE